VIHVSALCAKYSAIQILCTYPLCNAVLIDSSTLLCLYHCGMPMNNKDGIIIIIIVVVVVVVVPICKAVSTENIPAIARRVVSEQDYRSDHK